MRSTTRLCFSLLLLFSLVCPLHVALFSAGVDQWTSNGPEGGTMQALAIAPSNPNIIYAGTSGGGVFKSTDGGASWAAINSSYTSIDHILALTVDSTNAERVVAGDWTGLAYTSTDGGAHWARAYIGQENANIYALAIDPADPNIVYAGMGDDGGIFKSTDGGSSWSRVRQSRWSTFVQTLVIDPSNPNVVYAGTISGGIYRPYSGGRLHADDAEIAALSPDATPVDNFYGILKSTNGGASWQSANRGLGDPFTDAVVIDPVYTNVVYVATERGIYRSVDSGANWSSFVAGLTNLNVSSLTLNPTNSKRVYATTIGNGVVQQQITRPEIFSASYEAKKLNLSGRNFADAVRVLVNNTDRSDFLVSLSETGILLKAKAKKLGLKAGTNTITVIDSRGQSNSFFTFEF